MIQTDKPVVACKRTKLQEIFDYCLDNKIEFQVKEKITGIDEFEVTLDVENVKKAVMLGMFLRENRLELAGMPQQDRNAAAKKPAAKKPVESIFSAPAPKEEKKTEINLLNQEPEIEEEKTAEPEKMESPLSFDLN